VEGIGEDDAEAVGFVELSADIEAFASDMVSFGLEASDSDEPGNMPQPLKPTTNARTPRGTITFFTTES
jgi:hypothetical protein